MASKTKYKDVGGVGHKLISQINYAAKTGYQADKDKNVTAAKADYDNHVTNNKPGDFSSTYKGQLDSIYNQIMNRPSFSYDLSSDPMWQQYKSQYTALGKQAMTDTMGAAAGLTGGYGSTYSQNAGQQAYNSYLTQLNEMIPELYGMALNKYQLEGDQLNTAFNAANTLYGNEYGEYRDKVSDYNTDREFLYGVYSDQYDKGETSFNNRYNMLSKLADTYNSDYYSKKAQELDEDEFAWNKKMDKLNYNLSVKKASSSGSSGSSKGGKKTTYKNTAKADDSNAIAKAAKAYVKKNPKVATNSATMDSYLASSNYSASEKEAFKYYAKKYGAPYITRG